MFETIEDYRERASKMIEDMNKKWIWLVNKWGTLTKDVFAPYIDKAIEKYFGCRVDERYINYFERFDDNSLKLDIVAACRREKKLFIVEVKSNPDRIDYIDKFEAKLEEVRVRLKRYENYKLYPIYAGLDMKEETVKELSRRRIYAMVVRMAAEEDMLEIVNKEEVEEDKKRVDR